MPSMECRTDCRVTKVWIEEMFPERVAKTFGALQSSEGLVPWFTIAQTRAEYEALCETTIGSGPLVEWMPVGEFTMPEFHVIATPQPEHFEGWTRPAPKGGPR